jgi:ATP-dependent Clp protease ATP-binding subunit ClpA
MWKQYTDASKMAVFYAQRETERRGSGLVVPGDFLLVFLQEPGTTAARVLAKLGADVHAIRDELLKQLTPDEGPGPGLMRFADDGMQALDYAYEEAKAMGAPGDETYPIGTGHLLLGIMSDPGGLVFRVLSQFGITLENARETLRKLGADTDNEFFAPDPFSYVDAPVP